METGAITGYIDVAQLVLYLFWGFFAFLIFYLRREDKREGYPLDSDRSGRVEVVGFPSLPEPKVFALPHGGAVEAPAEERETRDLAIEPAEPWPGAPFAPTGDPMRDGVGPASWAQRDHEPDLTLEGAPRIVPMRVAKDFWVEPRDPDPRGMKVIGSDGVVAGTVRDIWVDRSEPQARYLELELSGESESRPVLLPITLAVVLGRSGLVRVASILSSQFAGVPAIEDANRVTRLEEDRICAYYAGGYLYAEPSRQEPLV